jgi:hypothetical protein
MTLLAQPPRLSLFVSFVLWLIRFTLRSFTPRVAQMFSQPRGTLTTQKSSRNSHRIFAREPTFVAFFVREYNTRCRRNATNRPSPMKDVIPPRVDWQQRGP